MAEPMKKETTEASQALEKLDTLSGLFEERDRPPLQEDASPGNNQKRAAPALSSLEPSELPEPSNRELETEAAEVDDQAINTPDIKTLQAELEKTRKTIAENQKYGRQNAQRLKSALKLAKEMVENVTVSESEAQSLMESLESNHEEELETSPYNSHPFGKVLKIANTELENLRKYSDDELLDDKVKAFDYFLSLASPEEVKGALEELTDLIDDPIKLTKKMLSIGKHYYETGYKDIKSAGGVFAYIDKKNQDIDSLSKTIDKLNKKLLQYEDFDKPRYRIAEMGNGVDGANRTKDTISALFEERDKVRRR
jgi:DNA-directed RNA polymerase subunit F